MTDIAEAYAAGRIETIEDAQRYIDMLEAELAEFRREKALRSRLQGVDQHRLSQLEKENGELRRLLRDVKAMFDHHSRTIQEVLRQEPIQRACSR